MLKINANIDTTDIKTNYSPVNKKKIKISNIKSKLIVLKGFELEVLS